MRKAVSILLLTMPFQWAGYLLVFKIQQHQIRHEIKQWIRTGVPEGELALLKIPRTLEDSANREFQRFHDREFCFQGMMYDIVRQEAHGDTTWYYCLSDEKEMQLFASLDELVKRELDQDPARKKPGEKLQRLLSSLFLCDKQDLFFVNPTREFERPYSFNLATWFDIPPIPPPEV